MNELKTALDEFMGAYRHNPPEEGLYAFLEELDQTGGVFEHPEKDWIEAGRSYGLSDDEIASWIETAASWLDDTTDQGEMEPEPAFWADGAETQENPSLKYGRGTEIEDCACEETCSCDPCPCDPCDGCSFCLCCCVCSEEGEDEEEDHDDEDDAEEEEDENLEEGD